MTKYKLKLLLVFLLSIICGSQSFASQQVPDYIIFQNDTIPTYNLILEQYLQKKNLEEDKLFGLSFRNTLESESFSLNCWRGYQAVYQIENDSLFLSYVIECGTIKRIDKDLSNKNLREIFGSKVKNSKVFIDWFSGEISFPIKSDDKQNEIIRWDGVFENIFLFETLIRIDKGKIKYTKEIQNYIDNPNRINRRLNDTISNILFDAIQNYSWTKLKKIDCSERYRIRINKKGRIDLVEWDLSKKEIKDFDSLEKREYRHCKCSIKRALKGLKFDIVKRKGQPIEEYIYIEIWFEDDERIENRTY